MSRFGVIRHLGFGRKWICAIMRPQRHILHQATKISTKSGNESLTFQRWGYRTTSQCHVRWTSNHHRRCRVCFRCKIRCSVSKPADSKGIGEMSDFFTNTKLGKGWA